MSLPVTVEIYKFVVLIRCDTFGFLKCVIAHAKCDVC